MRLALALALGMVLLAGPVSAQDEVVDVSTAARSFIGIDAATLMEAETLDCAGLREKVASQALVLTMLLSPEVLLPAYRMDFSAIGDEQAAFEVFVQAHLALYAVIAVEKGCFPSAL